MIDAQEQERKRIARELHDDLSQQVAALSMSMSSVKKTIPESFNGIRDEIGGLQALVFSLSKGIRQVSHQLHPAILEHSGLVAGLRSYCAEFSSLTDIKVEFRTNVEESLSPEVALCLYRVTQEALHYVAKHSGTNSAQVVFDKTSGSFQLAVTDNGNGFDGRPERKKAGLGLSSMEERVRLVNGSFVVTSKPGFGTSLLIAIPLRTAQQQGAALSTSA